MRITFGVYHENAQEGEPNALVVMLQAAGGTQQFLGPPAAWPKDIVGMLGDPNVAKIGYRLKQQLSALKVAGVEVKGQLLDISIAKALLGHHIEIACPSSLEDVHDRVSQAANEIEILERSLEANGLAEVFHRIEMLLIPVLIRLEREGIRADKEILIAQRESVQRELQQKKASIDTLAGRPVNLDSLTDVGELLFKELRISDNPRRTRNGQFATDAETLQQFAHQHPIIREIIAWREQATLLRGYLDQLPRTVDPSRGRIYTTYESSTAATGRLTSKNPNLQNIPVRTSAGKNVRRAFLPRDGNYLLLSADYSQIEMRVLATLSREPSLIEAFQRGDDVHTDIAASVYNVARNNVTNEMRQKAKVVNYGICYGMSAFGLAQSLGISHASASEFISEYFAKLPGLRQFAEETIAFAREHGFVKTINGRRRYLPTIDSRRLAERKSAERQAINSPIQGTVADMLKIAMVQIEAELESRRLSTRMLLQVHDELVFDLYVPEKEEVVHLVEEKMTTALPLEIPITVHFGMGRNWLEAVDH